MPRLGPALSLSDRIQRAGKRDEAPGVVVLSVALKREGGGQERAPPSPLDYSISHLHPLLFNRRAASEGLLCR